MEPEDLEQENELLRDEEEQGTSSAPNPSRSSKRTSKRKQWELGKLAPNRKKKTQDPQVPLHDSEPQLEPEPEHTLTKAHQMRRCIICCELCTKQKHSSTGRDSARRGFRVKSGCTNCAQHAKATTEKEAQVLPLCNRKRFQHLEQFATLTCFEIHHNCDTYPPLSCCSGSPRIINNINDNNINDDDNNNYLPSSDSKSQQQPGLE